MIVRYCFVGYGAVFSDYFTMDKIGNRRAGDTMIWKGQQIIILGVEENK